MKAEIKVPHHEVIKAVGKETYASGKVSYWYQLLNGTKMSYSSKEKFQYQLRNQAQVVRADKLVEQLDKEAPDLVSRVVSKFKGPSAKFEVLVRVEHESTAETISTILSRIDKLGRVGHSFGIKSDSDPGSLGGWDGDGHDRILGISIVNLETGEVETTQSLVPRGI